MAGQPEVTDTVADSGEDTAGEGAAAGPEPAPPPPEAPAGTWLHAGVLQVDEEREAALAFDRHGTARLAFTLDRSLHSVALDPLDELVDLLFYLRIEDLDPDYPRRHQAAFGLPEPLPSNAFGQGAVVEVAAPAGVHVPKRFGVVGVEAYRVDLDAGGPEPPSHAGPVPADPGSAEPRSADPGPPAALDAPAGRDAAAEPAPRARPQPAGRAGAALDRVDAALGTAGGRLVEVTGLPAKWLCGGLLGLVMVGFVAMFTFHTWATHARFGTFGFDLGIFDQGTWLLSQLHDPFVTIRGLHLFGDHASYILALVAPLYHLWADPRLLLLLQVLGLTAPALAIFHLARTRLANPAAALTLALAYLAYPGMQWAITWQFHPETLAAGFLAGAVVAADTRRGRLLAVCVTLALLCKEDVGLVVAGLGLSLWLTGQPVWGKRLLLAGLGWFLLATFVLIPQFNDAGSLYLQRNYNIQGTGPLAVFRAVPGLFTTAITFALSNEGLIYLFLVLAPLAFLPLLSWRWLLPVLGPVGLSLAALNGYQHEIRFQYLATSAPFLALAAADGLARLKARRPAFLAGGAVALLLCAGLMTYNEGPSLLSASPELGQPSPSAAAKQEAFALIGPDAGVSAQYNMVSHLAHRTHAYEFPNPWNAANWALGNEQPGPERIAAVDYVLVEPALHGPAETELVTRLRQTEGWETLVDRDGVLLLGRPGR